MNPIIILPTNTMSLKDIERLRKNGLCVVTAKNPAAVKFVDPIPAVASRTKIENAAISLSRVLLNRQWGDVSSYSQIGISEISQLYIKCLIGGTPLDSCGTIQEQEQGIIDRARRDELERIGREEARARRAAKKAADQKTAAKPTVESAPIIPTTTTEQTK